MIFRRQTKSMKTFPKEKQKTTESQIRRGVLDPQNRRLSLRLAYISIAWILAGLLIFLSHAQFKIVSVWSNMYFLWDKSKDCLLLATIYYAIPTVRPFILPVWIFLLLRLCTEIVISATGWNPNNQIVITVHFMTCSGVIVYLTFKQLLKEWKLK